MEASRSGGTASIDEEEEESWSGVARALESCFMPAILEAAMMVNSLRCAAKLRRMLYQLLSGLIRYYFILI